MLADAVEDVVAAVSVVVVDVVIAAVAPSCVSSSSAVGCFVFKCLLTLDVVPDSRKSNPETSLARLLLIQNIAGCLHYPALTRVAGSESTVLLVQACKLRAFPASRLTSYESVAVFPAQACKLWVLLASRLVSYESVVFPALRATIYHFRFDYSRISVNDTRDSQLTGYF